MSPASTRARFVSKFYNVTRLGAVLTDTYRIIQRTRRPRARAPPSSRGEPKGIANGSDGAPNARPTGDFPISLPHAAPCKSPGSQPRRARPRRCPGPGSGGRSTFCPGSMCRLSRWLAPPELPFFPAAGTPARWHHSSPRFRPTLRRPRS